MPKLSEHVVSCPCCGEAISVLIDHSLCEQNYTEDCQVCCQPILLDVAIDGDEGVLIVVRAENE